MRLFFAIALDEAARAAVAEAGERVQQQLARRRAHRAVKWVERENLHVTLRFIGEVDDVRGGALVEAVTPAIAVAPYAMTIGQGGCFPAAGPPRVAWIGVGTGADETRRVFDAIERRVAPLGFEGEQRAYAPHLTLGRVREIDRAGSRVLRDALAAIPVNVATMDVRHVTLYRSRLSPRGPQYEALRDTPLS